MGACIGFVLHYLSLGASDNVGNFQARELITPEMFSNAYDPLIRKTPGRVRVSTERGALLPFILTVILLCLRPPTRCSRETDKEVSSSNAWLPLTHIPR